MKEMIKINRIFVQPGDSYKLMSHITRQLDNPEQLQAEYDELTNEYLSDEYTGVRWPDVPYDKLFDIIEKYCEIIEPVNLRGLWIQHEKDLR